MPKRVHLHDKAFKVFIEEKEILIKIESIAKQINEDYSHTEPLFLIVLKGAFMFGSELVSRYQGHCHLGFVNIKSYQGMKSTGNVQVSGLDPDIVKGREVIILEDIVDSGRTLYKFLPILNEMQPANVQIATLLYKPDAMKFHVPVNYSCFDIPNDFVIGFGLDYDGLGRNYRDIYQLAADS